ncbi:DUF1045 domain-containing protein [Burkholderia humptydooensis]|uniref:DUF1045 domain-containing protein n=4 Tax=Burkholderia humptydooensis TaxID=430531 RepID=A0A7U4P253_9BURK|nr:MULTISPECIES: DUF1045 domain-containing protein [Burkholderia]AJY41649.1 2'-5' RNA ligase superfamily protein [Burkholderia sp. 2002721687]ALX41599.1 phosphonate metabolism protein [Burkholderia humptydooensis]EIP88232.1 hypothetical protein A33K_14327 [Burkholderia humptydooensis MSMB43]QPS43229.1 DUF1045 domain-containing protein [Burkholderia humptydooensis]
MRADLAARSGTARFALYYAPPRASAWWRAGCAWLGRDPEDGATLAPPQPGALRRPVDALTVAPRRYGWHATLVAPFALRPGVAAGDLVAAAADWARTSAPLAIDVDVAALGAFVALRPAHAHGDDALRALAAHALHALAPLRRPPGEAERAKRAAAPLTERQRALLAEWGYPYVLDEYRFHMTLSDSLDDPAERATLIDWWKAAAAPLGPLPVDHAAIFVEAEPGAPFMLWKRLPFGERGAESTECAECAASVDSVDPVDSGEGRR